MERPISFLKLPRELISVLVNDWLTWENVSRWDGAICNKEHRLEWLDILKTNSLTKSVFLSFDRSDTFNGMLFVAFARVSLDQRSAKILTMQPRCVGWKTVVQLSKRFVSGMCVECKC